MKNIVRLILKAGNFKEHARPACASEVGPERGDGQNASFDKKTLKRLLDIERLTPEDKGHAFAMFDAFLIKCDIQKNFAT